MSEKKRFINIGTIGHVDHGKTTFTAAITRALHEKFPELNKSIDFEKIDKAPEERQRGITINATTITYSTERTQFSHTDCPGHADYVKNMITGATQLDAAILIVDVNGADVQTREHILLASKLGIEHFAVFFNKVDMLDPEELEDMCGFAQEEILELMVKHGIKEENILFGKGSALKALEGDKHYLEVLANFITEFDNKLPNPPRKVNEPFKMSIGDKFSITGRGTVVAGVVESGTITLNSTVEIVKPGKNDKNITSTVTGIEAFNKQQEQCEAGNNVGILLRGVDYETVSKGDILAAPNTIKKYKGAKVEMYILTEQEGGRHTPLFPNYRPQFFIRTANHTGSINQIFSDSGQEAQMLNPGDSCSVVVEFEKLIPMEKGIKVVVREGKKTIAEGKITDVLDEDYFAKLQQGKKAQTTQNDEQQGQ